MSHAVYSRDKFPERTVSLAAGLSPMRKPDFFIVGAPKCGTTALYSYLKSHPEVFMSLIKEPQFFAEETISDPQAIRSFGDYRELFAGATTERRVGEASTAYVSSRCAPGRIKSFQPDTQIIIMLRHPVDMMYSLHGTLYSGGVEAIAGFAEALRQDEREKADGPRLSGRHVEPPYRLMAAYASQVERYFQVFGRDRVCVLLYDDFKAQPSRVFRSVLRFLDLSTDFEPRFCVVNPSPQARSKAVQKLLRKPPSSVHSLVHAILPVSIRRFIGESLMKLNDRALPPIDPALRLRLIADFEPEVRRLSRLLGRDLSAWCAQ
jgi:Sulfotransferase domain